MSGDVEQATSSLAGLEVSESEPSPSSPAAQPSEPGAAAAALAEQPEGQASLTVPLKLLVPQAAAGCIIGKNGETITRIQAESSARLQLSRANEFFPGTNDRVLLISGTLKVVIAGLHFVLGKVQEEQNVRQSMLSREGDKLTLRMLVPVPLCGCIIGKGGQVIRGIMDDSKAAIAVSSQEKHPQGLPDRIVKMAGERDQLMRATAQILQKLMENASFARFMNNNVSYPLQQQQQQQQQHPQQRGFPGHLGGFGGPLPMGPPLVPDAGLPRSETTMAVPENRVGAIIGKGGEVINNLKSLVGVRIRVSNREDFFPGTKDRKVTISGSAESVQIAQALIAQKISSAGPVQ